MWQNEVRSEKFVGVLGILPVMVLETNEVTMSHVGSRLDEAFVVILIGCGFILSTNTNTSHWNSMTFPLEYFLITLVFPVDVILIDVLTAGDTIFESSLDTRHKSPEYEDTNNISALVCSFSRIPR